MLRITVELVPYGDEDRARKIGTMVIANDGEGSNNTGNYQAWTAPDQWSGEPARFGRLNNYDRSQSVWELIRRVLQSIRLEDHTPDDNLSKLLKKRLNK